MSGRYGDTKLKIVRTLDEIMKSVPLGSISVSDVCARAGISRTAFYHHFSSIYEVPCWFWLHLIEQSLARIGKDCTFYQGHLQCFEMLTNYRTFFGNAFKVSGMDSPVHQTERYMVDMYLKMASERNFSGFTREQMLLIHFYNAGASGMTRQWACTDMQESPQEMAACFNESAPEFLKAVLEGRA